MQAVRNAQNNYVSAKGFIRQLDVLRLAASLLIANSFTRLIRPIEPLVQESKKANFMHDIHALLISRFKRCDRVRRAIRCFRAAESRSRFPEIHSFPLHR